MKNIPLVFTIFVGALLASSPSGPAGAEGYRTLSTAPDGTVPNGINYQGRLEKDGTPVTGTKAMEFRLYDAATGGTALWESGAQSVQVTQGLFGVGLDIPVSALYGGAQKYLEMEVGGVTLSPREPLRSVPYAKIAETVEGTLEISTGGLKVSTLVGDTLFVSSETGQVGIGTASPEARLHVSSASATASDTVFQVSSGTAAGQDILAVKGDGKVGLWTTSPAGTLHIANVPDSTVALRISGSQTVDINMGGGGSTVMTLGGTYPIQFHSNSPSYFGYRLGINETVPGANLEVTKRGTDDLLNLTDSSDGDLMTVTSAGEVGIGTTAPSGLLHVVGGDVYIGDASASDPSGQEDLFIKGNLVVDGQVIQQGTVLTELAIATATVSGELFKVAEGTFTVLSNGNVGIGTTLPKAALHIGSRTTLRSVNDNTWLANNVYHDGSNPRYIETAAAALYNPATDGSHKFYFAASGTADTVVTLTEILKLDSAGATFNDGSADLDFRVESDNDTHAFFVQGSDGHVGVGDSGPSSALDLKAGSGDPYAVQISSNDDTSLLVVEHGGNVGVGTASPSESLHVYDAGTNDAIRIMAENADTGTAASSRLVLKTQDSQGEVSAYPSNSVLGGNWADRLGVFSNSGDAGVSIAALDASGDIRIFSGGEIERVRVTATGNVGIGTVVPEGRLHVVGTSATDPYLFVTSHTGSGFGLVVSTTGNVGIGTETPRQLVHVHEASGGNSRIHLTNTDTGSGSSDGIDMGLDASDNFILGIYEASDMQFFTNGLGTPDMVITSGGNVGVSSTNPSGLFTVGDGLLLVESAGRVGIGDTGPSSALDLKAVSGDEYAVRISSSDDTALMIVEHGGRVGIGDAAPGSALDLKAVSGDEYAVRISSSDDTALMVVEHGGNVSVNGTLAATDITITGPGIRCADLALTPGQSGDVACAASAEACVVVSDYGSPSSINVSCATVSAPPYVARCCRLRP
ncbi:MAG: hypothetical protein ABII00_02905 [Elusimicrobiota bacterium]